MKKLLSILLCISLCALTLVPMVIASEKEIYPVICVPGYSSAALCSYKTGEQVHVWNIEIDKILKAVVENAGELGIDLGALAKGDAKKLSDTIGREFVEMFGLMGYDETGMPVDETLCPYYTSADKTNTAWLKANEDGKYIHENEIMPYISEYLGDKADEWTFNFNTDFRQNAEDCAADLDKYIDDVLKFTGAKKVNLLAVSHGGQISATYLALYGGEKVNNAVLTVPAIGGALLAYDIVSDQIVFDEETLLYFIQNGMMFEEDYDWLVKAEQFGFLDEVLHYLRPYILQILGNWGSIWDFIPAEYYEECKANFASETLLSSEVIAKSDRFHNSILPELSTSLKNAENDGANIYIIAGTSWPSVVGSQINSDAIISVNSSTGATVAPLGSRFSDGYKTLGTICFDETHNHLSPAMEIDASTCYLPDTTWFVRGLFHGMTLKDDYSAKLMKTLIESNSHQDIFSMSEYPQFHDAMNTCESVYCEFNQSKPGYVSGEDNKLVITNLSKKNKMQLLAVKAKGADISFNFADYAKKTLAPGESVEVEFSGELPKISLSTMEITVAYFIIGSITPLNERTQFFTIMNGGADIYDAQNPYTLLKADSDFKTHINSLGISETLDKYGLTPLFEVIYNIVSTIIGKYLAPLMAGISK